MNKTIAIAFIFVICILPDLFAQEGAVANGWDAAGSGGTASYSIGLIDYTSASSSSGSVYQGIQQPLIIPATPTVTVSDACGSSTLTSSTTTGTYLWSPGGATTQSITVTTGGTYSVTVTVNGCTSIAGTGSAAPVTVPAAPIVSSPVSYCQNSTAAPLTATGTALLWYVAATGGTGNSTAPTPLTTSLGSTDYYVSQTISACESPRALIRVDITSETVAPTVTTPVTYCQNDAAVPLTETGTALLWYTAASGGTGSGTAPTPSTTAVTTVSYYVSQTQCGEGPRAQIDVITNAIPGAPTVTVTDTCSSSTLSSNITIGSYLWSTGETTNAITVTTGGIYSVTITESGCTSMAGTRTAGPLTVPTTPTVTVSDACGSSTLTSSTTTGTYLWSPGGATTQSITVTTGGTYSVTVTVNGCTSIAGTGSAAPVTVPAAPIVSGPVSYCQNSTAAPLTATGAALLWYVAATDDTGNSAAPTPLTTSLGSTNYYVSQTISACESTRAQIDVTVNPVPAVSVNSATVCAGSSATLTASGATTYSWSPGGSVDNPLIISPATTTSYSVTGSTAGCSKTAAGKVTVNNCDVGIQEANASLQEFTIYPNPTSGVFNISITNANFKELFISVINVLGKEVFSASDKNVSADYSKQINLENLAEGIYYIKLSIGTDTKIKKLIIQ